MTKKYSYRLFILLILFLTACSTIEMQYYRIPEEINIIQKIKTDFIPEKCLYSSINKTAFILEKEANIIHIYKNGKKINTIGGLGFTSTSFNKLADITLSPDGNLLALDSFQKKVKKFDTDGRWITEFDLKNTNSPTLFDISVDETFYIYDENLKEIIVEKNFDSNNYFTFGKFQFKNPSLLTLTRNFIIVYDKGKKTSLIFDTLGKFIEEKDGKIQYDNLEEYKLEINDITNIKSNKKFAISVNHWNNFLIKNNFCIILSDSEIWITKLLYESN